MNYGTLNKVEGVKDLGIYFDRNMIFNIHVETTAKYAIKLIGFIVVV